MPMGDLARTDEYDPFDAEKFANPAVKQVLGGILTLPQRAIQNSQFAVDTGVYDPAVPVEAAMTVMGGSAVPRVPVKAGEVAVGSGPIRAYHSSPHDFDRFDLSKIGTGEGAQVYGHGLYFAENPAVSGQGGQYWNQFLNKFKGPERDVAERLKAANFDRKAAAGDLGEEMAWLEYNAKHANSPEAAAKHTQMLEALQRLESGAPVGPRTYEVNINADPAHMLDWDKPLREQPTGVRNLLDENINKLKSSGQIMMPDYMRRFESGDLGGEQVYRGIASGGEKASGALNEAGIPGIKYLDEGSRGHAANIQAAETRLASGNLAGASPEAWQRKLEALRATPTTSNYVVFDPSIVNIMKKYGIAGAAPVGMGALAAQDYYQPEERY